MKKRSLLGLLSLVLLITGCGGGETTSSSSSSLEPPTTSSEPSTSSVPSTEVAEEDQVRPAYTNLEYNDYGEMGSKPKFDTSKWYRNDLKDMPLPDPDVIEVGDKYYIFGTTDRTGSKTFDCYETEDFNTYTLHMNIEQTDDTYWGEKTMFAPEVYYYDGLYYLYYSDNSKTTHLRYINVMTSENPDGPYVPYKGKNAFGEDVDAMKEPLFRHNDSLGLSVLDQTLLFDDDGSIYMYYSVYDTGIMQYIVGFEMLDPVTPNFDTYKILVRPGEPTPKTLKMNTLIWEAYSGFKVAEGPYMLKSPTNGKYYLTYSVNHYDDRYYTVCYAVSDTPLGDYTKPYTKGGNWTNLLFGYAGGMAHTTVFDQWEGFMSGTAHHCFFKIGDQYMIGYHAHKDRKGKVDAGDGFAGRMFAMDYLFFDEEGTPYCEGPTYSLQHLPAKISGYENIALNATVKSTNVINPERVNDNFIVEHYNLPQEQDKEVTLPGGKSYIELDFDKEYSIGAISIYNSAFYDEYVSGISFINFFNGNVILDAEFPSDYINDEKEFIFPSSSFAFDFADIKATRVVIGFDLAASSRINEIKVFGREA